MAAAGAGRTMRAKKRMKRLLPALQQSAQERDPPQTPRPPALTSFCDCGVRRVRLPRAEVARDPRCLGTTRSHRSGLSGVPRAPSPVPRPPRASGTRGPHPPACPASSCHAPYSLGSTNSHSLSFPDDIQAPPKPISTFSSFRYISDPQLKLLLRREVY